MTLRNRLIAITILILSAFYAVLVVGFNALWHQPFPQGNLIRLAELELSAKGVGQCQNQEGVKLEILAPSEHDCRWWRLPYVSGEYCGQINELIKPSQNCLEIIFEEGTPEIVLDSFREVFQKPCSILRRYNENLYFNSMHRDLHCDAGSDYRRFTTYLLIVEDFGDNETKRLVRDFGDVLSVERFRRTRIWQFI